MGIPGSRTRTPCAPDNKLWILKETQVRDGEGFLLQIGNPGLATEVQLDYQLLEGDYVTSLRPQWTPWQVDGITYDPQWNPISYQIVTQRPNDVLPIVWPQQHKVDAKYVIHYFRQERPAQGRGIPEDGAGRVRNLDGTRPAPSASALHGRPPVPSAGKIVPRRR